MQRPTAFLTSFREGRVTPCGCDRGVSGLTEGAFGVSFGRIGGSSLGGSGSEGHLVRESIGFSSGGGFFCLRRRYWSRLSALGF